MSDVPSDKLAVDEILDIGHDLFFEAMSNLIARRRELGKDLPPDLQARWNTPVIIHFDHRRKVNR